MPTRTTPTLTGYLRRLDAGQSLSWADLDPWLDGDEASFAKEGKKLRRGLERKGITIVNLSPNDEQDCYESYGYHAQGSLRADGVAPYEKELGRLPRLNRTGEFRFARRYAFYRSWVGDLLSQQGFEGDRVKQMLIHEDVGNIDWPSRCSASAQQEIRRRLAELMELRNAFLHGTLYIVMTAVHKYRGRGIDTLDLVQEGNVSLYQALEGFDYTRDVRFKTYAEYWVNQAFLKILYNGVRTVRVPVWVQKALKKIRDLQTEIRQKEGREASPDELGAQLDMPGQKVKELIETQRYAISIDAEIGGDEDASRVGDLLHDEDAAPVHEQIEDLPLAERLQEVLADLGERERMILELRFGLGGQEPQTLSEVGKLLKVSAERVRQLQEAALKRLKMPKSKARLEPFMA
jgi:RNA polymerase primary sigma factor